MPLIFVGDDLDECFPFDYDLEFAHVQPLSSLPMKSASDSFSAFDEYYQSRLGIKTTDLDLNLDTP